MDKKKLYQWCSYTADELVNHPDLKVPFRMVETSEDMGRLMARELADEIIQANREGRKFRAIIPCGPKCWYQPFAEIVNKENISLRNMEVFIWMSAWIGRDRNWLKMIPTISKHLCFGIFMDRFGKSKMYFRKTGIF